MKKRGEQLKRPSKWSSQHKTVTKVIELSSENFNTVGFGVDVVGRCERRSSVTCFEVKRGLLDSVSFAAYFSYLAACLCVFRKDKVRSLWSLWFGGCFVGSWSSYVIFHL